eukprot:349646-Chlamydomonas_euryale.AAC.2
MPEKTDTRAFVRRDTHLLRRRPIYCVRSTPCGANAVLRNPQHPRRQPLRVTCAYRSYCTRRAAYSYVQYAVDRNYARTVQLRGWRRLHCPEL